jgi:hypothetical protein
VPSFDVPGLEVTGLDVPDFDVPSFDVPALDDLPARDLLPREVRAAGPLARAPVARPPTPSRVFFFPRCPAPRRPDFRCVAKRPLFRPSPLHLMGATRLPHRGTRRGFFPFSSLRPCRLALCKEAASMPKYVIEREIPGASTLSDQQLHAISQTSCGVLRNLGPEIQWVQSYVAGDKIYCIYNAPSEELIRQHATQGGFPANLIARVSKIIDPTTAEA